MILRILPILILLNAQSNSSAAQNYIDLPDSNASWSHIKGTWLGAPFNPVPQIDVVTNYCVSGQDTIINGTLYTKLNYCDSIYKGGLRSNNGKTFFVPADSTQEYLAYDFSVNIGDTLFDVYVEDYSSYDFVLVDYYFPQGTIDSILIQGHYRRRIYPVGIGTGGGTHPWIEGVGCNQGLFKESGANVSLYFLQLYCFNINDTVVYHNPQPIWWGSSVGICQPPSPNVSVVNPSSPVNLSVYPQPFDNFLNIRSSKNATLSIYNSIGSMIKSFDVQSGIELTLSIDVPPGVYYLKNESNFLDKGIAIFKH